MKYCFGVDIGGTTVKLGLFTDKGDMLEKWEIPSNKENHGEKVPQDIATAILDKLKDRSIDKSDVLGIGMGIPGPVREDGVVMKCANLGWDVIDIGARMKELTGMKCVPANDANVAALGELFKGGAAGYKNLVFITLGTGVGGGIVIDGKSVHGVHGGGGEIGHIVVNSCETAVCGCGGHGHLEQYASATGVVRVARKKLSENDRSSLMRNYPELSAKDVFDCAKQGDELAMEAVDTMCAYLAQALSGVAATCDPEVYVIGGGVSKAGTIITDKVKQFFDDNNMNVLSGREFKLATLGNDAGMYGAAYLALNS